MARKANQLTAVQVRNLTKAGKYEDGSGLRLVVSDHGARNWVLRASVDGRRREFGLGGYPDVSLEQARRKAEEKRVDLRSGSSPQTVKLSSGRAAVPIDRITFRMAFAQYYATKEKTLSNEKHREQWRSTMNTYVFPFIGDTAVQDVTGPDIRKLLLPIWNAKQETARRVLQRVKVVFAFTIFNGWRATANPCEGVKEAMHSEPRCVEHYRAMPYTNVPAFVRDLQELKSWPETKLAFEWLILTATRSGETRGARWDEIDEKRNTWVIPAERMKKRKKHIVPLCGRCLEILGSAKALQRRSVLIFPSQQGGVLSDMTLTKLLRDHGYAGVATAHGFRSSFRDWCAEVAKVDEDVAEAALAHEVKDKTKAAYKRAQFLEERRVLMQRWDDYLQAVEKISKPT